MDNDIYTFGMSDYGQSQCAEIFDVEYYDCKEVKIGDTIVDFECEKIYIPMDTPIPGTVVQINEKLKANPDLFNTSPETEGWICKIKTTAPEAQELFKNMMDEKEYRTLCKIKRAERDSYWAIAEIRMISHQNQKKQ
ncbi:glycine cleavage system H-protein subunit [Mortierella sp. AD094]|nr:glycine cleavage system H-protein subunit [Mortierella sp. AD094]